MKNLIRKLLGPSQPPSSSFTESNSWRDDPLTIEDGSDNAIRRQLIQMLLRDVMRLHGIPARWIECQMLVVTSKSRGPGMYVRLVIREWDERLMKYAFAFQSALFADVLRFEPRAADWLHGISWQLELGNSSPYTTLPDPSYWAAAAARGGSPYAAVSHKASAFAPTVGLDELDGTTLPSSLGPRTGYPVRTSVPVPEDEAMIDLERLFFDRDLEISSSAQAVGYETTQPAPLN